MNHIKHRKASNLTDSYNQMLSRIRQVFENTGDNSLGLNQAMRMAMDECIHIGEVSLEDAREICNFIRKDVNEAAEYLMETSHEFSDWLMLDIEIVERRVVEMFLSVADKTRIEIEHLSEKK